MARWCRPGSKLPQHKHGFTYLGLLIGVVIVGATLAAAGQVWHTASVREREVELLFAGDQIRRAIASYHDETPAGQVPAFPSSLDALLDDRRWPTTRRHLRKVFVDPMTASRDWGLVAAPTGGVMGVYSRSEGVPLRRANFPAGGGTAFAQAKSYRDWKFVHAAATAASSPGAATKPGIAIK